MYNKQRNRMRRKKYKNCFIYLKESKEEEKKQKNTRQKASVQQNDRLNMHILIITQGQMH